MAIRGEIVELELHDSGANHHKYYRAYRFGETTVFQWGRVGASPQSQRIVHSDVTAALKAFQGKVTAKHTKGYGYTNDVAAAIIPPDILELDPTWRDRGAKAEQTTSINPVEALSLDIDRCRRLAMGTQQQLVEAIVLRQTLNQQLEALRTSVLVAEGGIEFVDVMLGAAV